MKQAPACVETVETIRSEWALRLIQDSGIEQKSIEMRDDHRGSFRRVHHDATVLLQRLSLRPCTRGKGVIPIQKDGRDFLESTELARGCLSSFSVEGLLIIDSMWTL